jgi:hypothetical protein
MPQPLIPPPITKRSTLCSVSSWLNEASPHHFRVSQLGLRDVVTKDTKPLRFSRSNVRFFSFSTIALILGALILRLTRISAPYRRYTTIRGLDVLRFP